MGCQLPLERLVDQMRRSPTASYMPGSTFAAGVPLIRALRIFGRSNPFEKILNAFSANRGPISSRSDCAAEATVACMSIGAVAAGPTPWFPTLLAQGLQVLRALVARASPCPGLLILKQGRMTADQSVAGSILANESYHHSLSPSRYTRTSLRASPRSTNSSQLPEHLANSSPVRLAASSRVPGRALTAAELSFESNVTRSGCSAPNRRLPRHTLRPIRPRRSRSSIAPSAASCDAACASTCRQSPVG